jgi:Tol biopolymer transport system component
MKWMPVLSLLICNTLAAQDTIEPALFSPDNLTIGYSERDMALSPDGTEMFYTIQGPGNSLSVIVHRVKEKGRWQAPTVASFSGMFHDLEPFFFDNGKKLFFCSNRNLTGDGTKDFDIWYTEKSKDGWGRPVNLGEPVNTSADEFYPSVATNGNIYYTAQYPFGIGKEDIFVSRFVNGQYQKPQVLDSAINSSLWEFNAFIAPDESYILFSSCGRKDDAGRCDLYICVKDDEDHWKPAQNLQGINSNKLDYCPFVSTDGSLLYFTSERHAVPNHWKNPASFSDITRLLNGPKNGASDIYYLDFKKLLKSIR